jgi:selenide,water dikinase
VVLPAGFADWQRNLLTDPQTSGGLLITCATGAVDAVMAVLQAEGFEQATVFGQLQAGPAQLQVA